MDAPLPLQVAYLASSLFLDYKSDTIILVVNTLSTDLKSDNYLVGERASAFAAAWGHLAAGLHNLSLSSPIQALQMGSGQACFFA